MPSHKLSPRDKIRNKFSLRSRHNDRRQHRKNKQTIAHHSYANSRGKDAVYTDDYDDYDDIDETSQSNKYKGSVGESISYTNHKVHQDYEHSYKHKDTSTEYKLFDELEALRSEGTESMKGSIDIPTSKNKQNTPLYEDDDDEDEDEEDHMKRPEPLNRSSVEMLKGEYRSYDDNVYHFNTNSNNQKIIYDHSYLNRETSSVKNIYFDEATDDTLSISDFSLHNETEDSFDDSEKLIIVPSNIDIDDIKTQIKPKTYEEDFSNFNIDFEVKPYIETSSITYTAEPSTATSKESSKDKYEEISKEDVKMTHLDYKDISDVDYKETSTPYYKESITPSTKKNKVFIDDEFDIVEDIEQLKNIEDKIVAETIEEFTKTIKELPQTSNKNFNNYTNPQIDTVSTTEDIEFTSYTHSVSSINTGIETSTKVDLLDENILTTESISTSETSTSTETIHEEDSDIFDSLNSNVINQLFNLVKTDVELNLPILLNDQNYFVNFTKENFEKVILDIHNDSSLKHEFKEYLRDLVQNSSEANLNENREKEKLEVDTISNTSDYNEIKHFHVKKKELHGQETQQFIRVYQKIMLLSGFVQPELIDLGSGDHLGDDYDFLDREMGDQPFSEISLALPSKKDINSDYYEDDLKKKNKVTIDNDKNVADRAIKTFDTPSGRVKILYQVNEKENSKKDKDKNNVNVEPMKSETSSVHNTGKFLQESEKHKVSAVVTSDGKIGILVKSKPKNLDQAVDAEIYDDRSYPNPKLVPTKVSEGNDFSIKTTVLRPISGTEGISGSDRTVLKPIGTNVWTAIRRENNIKKTTAKTLNIGEIPYDDEYYDEDDIKVDAEIDQIDPTNVRTETPIEKTTLKITEKPFVENQDNKLNHNKTNEKGFIDSSYNKNTENNESETKQKPIIRTFDEDFLKGLQKNMSEERRDRKPDFSGIKNHNSIDYRKSHDKSVYLNILDILGPDSKDVIQLLKDVKHINNDRSIKKQLDFNHKETSMENEKKIVTNEENIPILNRNPVDPPKIDTGMSDLDERILRKDNEEVIIDHYKERERNRVDFHLNKHLSPGREPERDWNDDETHTKKLEDIWSDNEDELAEDSMVRIIPVHTGHSIFQKINLNKAKPELSDSVASTMPTSHDPKHKTIYSHIDKNPNTNNASYKNLETFKYRLVMCLCIIFSFSFYTAFSLIRVQSRYSNNIVYMHW